MVQNSQTSRIPGQAVKIGRGSITAGLLTLAVAGTYFGSKLVNQDDNVGLCAGFRCMAVAEATSTTDSGATTNTLWLDQAFGSGSTENGYKTGSSSMLFLELDVVSNPTGANFDCYLGRKNTATGSGIPVFSNVSASGAIKKQMSGSLLGPDMGIGCNTIGHVRSNTVIKAAGVFLRSAVVD